MEGTQNAGSIISHIIYGWRKAFGFKPSCS